MRAYTRSHLNDRDLRRDLARHLGNDRTATAVLLADLAEFDLRRLYLEDGYTSMFAYCVGELHLSDDAAYKRIQAARVARQFPATFTALEEGRFHLTAVGLLAPHLTRENADELLAAATHKTKPEIEQLLAQRFPRTEMLALVQAIPSSPRRQAAAPGAIGDSGEYGGEDVKGLTCTLAPAQVEGTAPRSKLKPHAPERFALHLTVSQETYDDLQYAQALLSHQIPAGDVAQVIGLALKGLIVTLEKRKFGKTTKPRSSRQRSSVGKRHIPAHVKRAVWERDQGQCTFVGANGHRCAARRLLEFDHIDPVARGGGATVERIRLRCRAHNQYEADRIFGAGFMSEKRDEATRAAEARRARVAAAEARTRGEEGEARVRAAEAETEARTTEAEAQAWSTAAQQARDLRRCLRELGFRADETRRAVEFCATIPDTTLEGRVRAALKFLCPKARCHGRVETATAVPV